MIELTPLQAFTWAMCLLGGGFFVAAFAFAARATELIQYSYSRGVEDAKAGRVDDNMLVPVVRDDSL